MWNLYASLTKVMLRSNLAAAQMGLVFFLKITKELQHFVRDACWSSCPTQLGNTGFLACHPDTTLPDMTPDHLKLAFNNLA
jgi:hypothetical protein